MNTHFNHRGENLASRFLETASHNPDRPALEKGNIVISYRELADTSQNIARAIMTSGDDRPFVAVMADKSPECYSAILGILMTGKGYLPLNPRFPEARNRFMLEKAGISTLIKSGSLEFLEPMIRPDAKPDPAYLLFTSGTTGEPKGVQISHGNVCSYLDFMLRSYDFSPEDRFTQNFDLTFDLSVHDLFLCWSVGACLCVPEDGSSFSMARFIKEIKPTAWFSVPSVAMLMDRMRLLKPGAFPGIRLSFFCGEPLYVKTAEAWRNAAPSSRIINLYGPTEATIAISHYELPTGLIKIKEELGIVSIGKVFENNHFLIHNADNSGKGELCLFGPQVTEGYFDNPAADQQSFFIQEKTFDKCYKTGDLVRVDHEGDLFYLGRSDSEVKISGYRVNLREVENVLNTYDRVDQAVVYYEADAGGEQVLLAFILPEAGEKLSEADITGFCRMRLPWYMVPGKIIFVSDLPLNANGKVDRAAILEKYRYAE